MDNYNSIGIIIDTLKRRIKRLELENDNLKKENENLKEIIEGMKKNDQCN